MENREFYIGYLDKAPRGVADFVRISVLIVAFGVAIAAALFSLSQGVFDPGTFEYGKARDLEGVILAQPYPLLLTSEGPALLVAVGKRGAGDRVEDLDQRRVRLRGARIERAGWTMFELTSDPIEKLDAEPLAASVQSLGPIDVVGEIVDSKCFLGVMKPGRGKPHRACAALCLEGGIPPVLHLRDPSGAELNLLLTEADGAKLQPAGFLEVVGEPVRVRGEVVRRAGLLELRVEDLRGL